MPILRLYISFAFLSGTLLAQQTDPPYSGIQRIIDRMVAQQKIGPSLSLHWASRVPVSLSHQIPGFTTPCSVPLLQAEIPQGVNFTMQKVPSSSVVKDSMPIVAPAPACPAN